MGLKTYVVRMFEIAKMTPDMRRKGILPAQLKPKRVRSIEITGGNMAEAKENLRRKLEKSGLSVRSIAYGSHNDLIAYVEK